jgi:hypothetical protein
MTTPSRKPSLPRLYPRGTGAGISLVVLITLGVAGIAQLDEAKRAAFREGFNCANNARTIVTHSSYNCQTYRANLNNHSSNAQRDNARTQAKQP